MKFLVESHNYIGDIMLDVPLFHAIADQGHHLEVLVGDRYSSMLEGCDFINAVHVKSTNLIPKFIAYCKVMSHHWDAILVTRHYPRYKILRLLGRTSVFRDMTCMHDTLYGNGAIPFRLSILDGLIDGWLNDIDTTLPIKQSRYEMAFQLAEICPGEKYLTVAPGASKPSKQWSLRKFASVINSVQNSYSQIRIVGSRKEEDLCSSLVALTSCSRSMAGKLDLVETCALVSGASQHIGNDSGLGHVAAGNGVPVVAVGGHSNGHFVPWQQQMLAGILDSIEPENVVAALSKISL